MSVQGGFAPFHRADRNFFLFMLALIWLGILMGFVPEMIRREPNFPAIVHLHSVIFVAWLVLLTVQIFLIRSRRIRLHKTLGLLGAMLAGAMIVVGPITGMVVVSLNYGTSHYHPESLSVDFGNIVAFAPLVTAGILLRENPSAHKRLLLLATIFICDPGFSRWLGGDFLFAGTGFVGSFLQVFLFNVVLALIVVGYDYATRRKIHPATLVAVTYGVLIDVVSIWLYVSPWWKPIAGKLIGR